MKAVFGALVACVATFLLYVSLPLSPATAAVDASKGEKQKMLAAAVASPGGRSVGLRVTKKGRVTMAPLASRGPATVLAVRSSVNPAWGLLVALQYGRADLRQSFLMKRSGSRWRVRWSVSRGSEAEAVCATKSPGTAIVLDLGLSSNNWGEKCRHKRERRSLVRRMSAGEVGSIRRMVEWKWAANGMRPGPVQPEVHDVFASDCAWDGRGKLVPRPVGEVAKSDPRWGMLWLTCVIGSDGFGALESTTVMLVRRSGRSGQFTRVLAHTHPSWSVRGGLCDRNRSWPVPAAPRVALEFCTPFPGKIRDALR